MAIHLKNTSIDSCVVGVSVLKDTDLHADGLAITRTGTGIEVRDPPSLMEVIGLPRDTPPHLLIEVLAALEGHPQASSAERIDIIRESALRKWLGVGADIVGLAAALTSAQARGLVSWAVEKLLG